MQISQSAIRVCVHVCIIGQQKPFDLDTKPAVSLYNGEWI